MPPLRHAGAETVVMGPLAFAAPDLGERMRSLHRLYAFEPMCISQAAPALGRSVLDTDSARASDRGEVEDASAEVEVDRLQGFGRRLAQMWCEADLGGAADRV